MDIIKLPIPSQIQQLSHFNLRDLNQIHQSQELASPFIVEKIFLQNLERKLSMVLEFMEPLQSMRAALLQNPNRAVLVSRLVQCLTVPGRPFSWDVPYSEWFREDILDLRARVRRAGEPQFMVRRRHFAIRRRLIIKMVKLIKPQETILLALRRMYAQNKKDTRLSHLWTAYLMEMSGPLTSFYLIYSSREQLKARLLGFEQSVSPDFFIKWAALEKRLERITAMVYMMLPRETVTEACARLPIIESNSLYLNAIRIRHELTTESRPFEYRVKYETWTREEITSEIEGVEKQMIVEAVLNDVYAA